MRLAIISHTEHYLDCDGHVAGWGPTVREINFMAPHFEKIYHIACLHKGVPPPSSLRYTGDNIVFIPIPASGSDNILGKISVLHTLPIVIRNVSRIIKKVDSFQVRLPAGFGNYLLPWLKIYSPKAKFWVKYAGNWAQKNPPLGYAFQRWFLRKNFLKCNVTVNGRWPNQSNHVITFENPCLTEQERIDGERILKAKNYEGHLDFIFIGQLNESKGVGRIIDTFSQLKDYPRVGMLRFIGDGPARPRFEKLASEAGIKCEFKGFLPKEEVNNILAYSHVLLLHSESEGFPKVVAECGNYGCIPVVSDVSCISQYIFNGWNGFLIDTSKTLKEIIVEIINAENRKLTKVAENAYKLGSMFTYSKYIQRLYDEIL